MRLIFMKSNLTHAYADNSSSIISADQEKKGTSFFFGSNKESQESESFVSKIYPNNKREKCHIQMNSTEETK